MNERTWSRQSIWMVSAAFLFALAGCTSSDSSETGGIDATLTLDAGSAAQAINSVTVTVACDGVDMVTGLPWRSETFDVDLSNSEGSDPLDPKNSVGVFKKEGLPPGSCTVTVTASSDDGATLCGGQMTDILVVAGPDNTFVSFVVNCVTDARNGGIGVDGEFNQCAEYSQIIVNPNSQTIGFDVDLEVWCYDPDTGDLPFATVMFVTSMSVAANPTDPATWQHCGTSPDTAFPPALLACPSIQDHPTDPGPPASPANQSLSTIVTCGLSDESCLVVVAISEDGFGSGGTDRFGCTGRDDNANAVVPVYCEAVVVCGDGIVAGDEDCDPPGDPNANNIFCDGNCQIYDPCENPNDPPASCPAPGDPQCAATSCTESGGAITCGIANSPDGTACDSVAGSGLEDHECQSGACVPPPLCTPGGCPGATDCQTAQTCDPLLGCQPGTPINEGNACMTSLGDPGTCITGECANTGSCTNPPDLTFVCGPSWDSQIEGCAAPCLGDGQCTADCLAALGVTQPCADCYGVMTICTNSNCFNECAPPPFGSYGPGTPQCLACLESSGCQASLESCAGNVDVFCTAPIPNFCGDGSLGGTEQCDDGNISSGDGCRGDCTNEACGDGIVDVNQGEACDDGNLVNGDGCDDSCQPDSGCIGENACRTHNKSLFGSRCNSWTVCIPTGGGWYSISGSAGGTTLGDVRLVGTAADLQNVTTGLTRRSDYVFLGTGSYTLEACDDTGAGIGAITGCVAPEPFISQPGVQSGNLSDTDTDNTGASSSRGNIDLAGPLSGGDECHLFEVAAAGDYQVSVSNDSGGAIMEAGLYAGSPADGNLVFGSNTGTVAVASSATGGIATLSPGAHHVCVDLASLGSFGNYTITLQKL